MNGRVYDPTLGRFIQADPHIQAPSDSQSLNRYSYVKNNPLSYTDPTGYFFKKFWKGIKKYWRVIVAAVASYFTFGWAQAFMSNFWATVSAGFVGGAVSTGTLKDAIRGAFTAAAMYGINAMFNQGSGPENIKNDQANYKPSKETMDKLQNTGGTDSGLYRVKVDPTDGANLGIDRITAADLQSGDTIFTNGIKNGFEDAVNNGTIHVYQIDGAFSDYVLNYNPTESAWADLLEAGQDAFATYAGTGHTTLANNLANTFQTAQANGVTGLRLIGHSQGGAITTSAIRAAANNGVNIAKTIGQLNLHGAPINNIYANYGLGLNSANVVTRAQFGDAVNVLGGFNIYNPLNVAASIIKAPYMLQDNAALSPHTTPCPGGRHRLATCGI